MALMNVEGTSPKAQAWRYVARSRLVFRVSMTPYALACDGGDVGVVVRVVGESGTVHSPFVGSRVPRMMVLWPFETVRASLVKTAVQLSSHSWPIERSDSDFRSLKMCASVAALDKEGASGIVAALCGIIVWPFATRTCGPVDVLLMLMQCGLAVVFR